MDKIKSFVSHSFFYLDRISNIKICHMVEKKNPEEIEGSQWLIVTDVLDSEEAAKDD